MDNGLQKRAKSGGEIGPNGEWYPGGAFIATTDHAKSVRFESRPVDEARLAAGRAEARRIAEWLESRQTALAGIVAALTANPGDVDDAVWRQRVIDHAAGFLPSLGRTLYMQGNLSERQAEYVAKAIIGRRTRKTEAQHDEMIDLLTQELG